MSPFHELSLGREFLSWRVGEGWVLPGTPLSSRLSLNEFITEVPDSRRGKGWLRGFYSGHPPKISHFVGLSGPYVNREFRVTYLLT